MPSPGIVCGLRQSLDDNDGSYYGLSHLAASVERSRTETGFDLHLVCLPMCVCVCLCVCVYIIFLLHVIRDNKKVLDGWGR